MTPSALLKQIQRRAGLKRSDCHPLYAYKVNGDELISLATCLRETQERQGKLSYVEDAAAFCLFAAESFRRRYEAGPWNWDTIYHALGWSASDVQSLDSQVYRVVTRGLQWWGLEVIRLALTKRYLGTLICQGGLPLRALQRDGGSLSKFLKECLRLHEQYPNATLKDIIAQRVYMLPASLDNSDFHALTDGLVSAIAKLRQQSELASKASLSRKEYLDQHHPGWDAMLPLRVDESDSLNLLLTLLDASKPRVFREGTFAVSTRFDIRGQQAELRRMLQFPTDMDEGKLLAMFAVQSSSDLMARMRMFIACGGQQSSCLAVVRNREEHYRFSKLDSFDGSKDGAEDSVRLILKAGQEQLGEFQPLGGQALPESPWIFTDADPHILIGVGSARSRHDRVIVAVPSNGEPSYDEDAEHSPLPARLLGRELVRLSGSMRVNTNDSVYNIGTRIADGSTSIFELCGREVQYGSQGSRVWLGTPQMRETRIGDDTTTINVPTSQIEWKPVHGGSWQPLNAECLGDVKIRIVESNITRFTTRAIVMPEDFLVQVKVAEGKLILRGLPKVSLGVEPKLGFKTTANRDDSDRLVISEVREDTSSLAHPGNIRIKLMFSKNREAVLCLPSPVQWIGLIDAAGRPLPKGPIPIDRLHGVTLKVVNTDARLMLFELGQMQFLGRPRATRVDGVEELNLGLIENYIAGILAQSDDPDAFVDIGLMRLGIEKQSWRICRYGRRLQKVLPTTDPMEAYVQPEPSQLTNVGTPPSLDSIPPSEMEAVDSFENASATELATLPEVTSEMTKQVADATDAYKRESEIVRAYTDFQLEDTQDQQIIDDNDDVILTLVPLGHPTEACEANCIETLNPGQWRIHHQHLQAGSYLLIGRMASNGEALRPIRLTISPDEIAQIKPQDAAPNQLFDAALSLRDKEERRQAWSGFMHQLANNPLHEGWRRLDDTVTACKTLPMTTFESVAALVRNPDAVVRMAFLRTDEDWLWEKLEHLPFMWSLVPISSWIRGAFRCRKMVADTLKAVQQDNEALTDESIEGMLRDRTRLFASAAPKRVKGLGCMLATLHMAGFEIGWPQIAPFYDANVWETRSQERSRLVDQHTRLGTYRTWPSRPLDVHEFARAKLREIPGLEIEAGTEQSQVLNAPAIAAIYCVFDFKPTEREVKQFQRMRGVDPEWFNVANAAAMQVLIEQRANLEPDCYAHIAAEGK